MRRVMGVELRVDESWFLVAFLVVWSFWARFTGGAGHHSVGAASVMAAAAAGLFFASVLAHELAHALEARQRGLRVRGITLHLFGGTTEIVSEARRPGDELASIAVGPYTTLVLAAALGLLAFASGQLGLTEVAEVSGVVAWINLGLALFNLIPAAPLDGGRILATVVWRITGDRLKAGRVAAWAGRVAGTLLLTAGLCGAFFVGGGFIAGLWLVLVGWFVLRAALAEQSRLALEAVLSGRRADALAFEEAEAVETGTSVGWITQAQLRRHHLDAVPVDEDGRAVGIVHIDDICRIAPEQRFETTAGDIMRPIEGVPRVAADDSASAVLAALDESGLVAITDGDTVVALVTPRQVAGVVQRLRLLHDAGAGVEVLR